jgi:hypothetical protein
VKGFRGAGMRAEQINPSDQLAGFTVRFVGAVRNDKMLFASNLYSGGMIVRFKNPSAQFRPGGLIRKWNDK